MVSEAPTATHLSYFGSFFPTAGGEAHRLSRNSEQCKVE